jgi:GYF domain 2
LNGVLTQLSPRIARHMDYYIYNPGGRDSGPFTFEQLQTKLKSGHLDPTTRIRGGPSADDRPLSEVKAGEQLAANSHSAVPRLGTFCLLQRFRSSRFHCRGYWPAYGMHGQRQRSCHRSHTIWCWYQRGFVFLALAAILDYLKEAVFRLHNLEEFATPRA